MHFRIDNVTFSCHTEKNDDYKFQHTIHYFKERHTPFWRVFFFLTYNHTGFQKKRFWYEKTWTISLWWSFFFNRDIFFYLHMFLLKNIIQNKTKKYRTSKLFLLYNLYNCFVFNTIVFKSTSAKTETRLSWRRSGKQTLPNQPLPPLFTTAALCWLCDLL